MKEKSISVKVKKGIACLAKKMAVAEANTACPLWGYQHNIPEGVKKMRKF
ncbi:cyclic lactone autoinducer peptide [Eisenbergiella tayi]|nr:cyclic lactone autoinducer peptide [Eisenbergiella tayi]EPC05216.1 cyclic lactone autoinducer peptide [Lachnospiraceae bacterium 3_1_57FAA_CT1]